MFQQLQLQFFHLLAAELPLRGEGGTVLGGVGELQLHLPQFSFELKRKERMHSQALPILYETFVLAEEWHEDSASYLEFSCSPDPSFRFVPFASREKQFQSLLPAVFMSANHPIVLLLCENHGAYVAMCRFCSHISA